MKKTIVDKFGIGDVVVLNSGSPPMTVSDIAYKKKLNTINPFTGECEDEIYECIWTISDGTVKRVAFNEKCLKLNTKEE